MECPYIDELKFSQVSKDAIENIRTVISNSNLLITWTGLSQVATIFLGSNMLDATVSLSTTDFEQLAKAMKTVPALAKNQIKTIAFSAEDASKTYQERQFWRAVYLGCNVH